jgi:curved DNA-binding protein CbpA
MKTFYDLLGARSDDDAEVLRAAFRRAAKANHPDLHAGDPYAAIRFRQIAEAYEILRDPEQRATYDQLLQFERERLRWKLKPTISYLMHSIVADAVTAIGLAVVLAGGYMIFAHISKTPAEQLLNTAARGPERIAAVQPAPTNMNKSDDMYDGPERAPEPIAGGGAPKAAGLNIEIAKITNASAVTIDRASSKTEAEQPDQSVGTGMPDRDNAQLVKVLSERDNGAADDTRDMKRRDRHDINASDVRISDSKIHGRPRIAAKRETTSHTTFEQASLENKNTCSGSQLCSRDVPPLFGVGF